MHAAGGSGDWLAVVPALQAQDLVRQDALWALVVAGKKAWGRKTKPVKTLYKGLKGLQLDDQGCPRLPSANASPAVATPSPAPLLPQVGPGAGDLLYHLIPAKLIWI